MIRKARSCSMCYDAQRFRIVGIISNIVGRNSPRERLRASVQCVAGLAVFCLGIMARGQGTQPLVAVHDSELTRALESMPATNATPRGAGTTSNEWWTTDWHYFVMPEAVKEALRSDGTAFTVVGDSNITAGLVLTNGTEVVPKYPILISLAAEAARSDEIQPLTNYVAAGGFLLVGSSAFTRNTNGTTRTNFAFATEMGVNMVAPALTNWGANSYFTKQLEHRLVSHIPSGKLVWGLPSSAEEISWGVSPGHAYQPPNQAWQVQASDATVVATGNANPCLLVKPFGKGYFIYYAPKQPLIGHGGWAPGMYAYMIFRRAIEWAFESAKLPVPKLSAWPYAYDAAFMVRHDLENFTNLIANIAASAQFEFTNGAKGDYYFCTGTLREDTPATNTAAVIAGLRQAVTNFGATIGPHNGGLINPRNPALVRGDYDYWHWGPDEALDVTPTNYASGKAYALTSISNSFLDVESWLTGITNGPRAWVSCYFNATREDSFDIQAQLGVKITGDQKLTPFPHWPFSTRTAGKRYSFLSQPVCDWYVSTNVTQDLEPWHPPFVLSSLTVHQAVDFYYNLGALINIYSHSLSTGQGDAGQLTPDYITYSLNTNLHPRIWSANAVGVYKWWLQRSNAQVTATHATNGLQSVTTLSITGATDTNTAVEVVVPANGSPLGLQVLTNSVVAGGNSYRTNGQVIRIRVGTAVTNAQVRYVLGPNAQSDLYSLPAGITYNVGSPGVLGNDGAGAGTNLTAALLVPPLNGSVTLSTNGGFSYTPAPGFVGTDSFTYTATNEQTNSATATVLLAVSPAGALFGDNFSRTSDPGSLSPWVAQSGAWNVTGGVLQAGPNVQQLYGYAYLTNTWTNYSVQARIQFSATNSWGGGIGGCLNPTAGAHYAAWVYPEGSPGGSKVLKLIKFQSWAAFGYNGTDSVPIQQVTLGSVGTNSHTLQLAFRGSRIAVYYDGSQVMSVTDVEAQPYFSGGVSVDTWTYLTPYVLAVDDVVIRPLAADDSYSVDQDTPLSVSAPGVLANDAAVVGTNLTAVLAVGPTNGLLTLSTNGSFTYTPNTNYVGRDSFTYQASDSLTNLGTATVALSVLPINHAPALPAQTNRALAGLASVVVTNTASDSDLPPQTLSYQLLASPPGATIDAKGVIAWTPPPGQGASTNAFTTKVSDNGVPPLSATNSFTVFITNTPVLLLSGTAFLTEGCLPTNNAVDPGETVVVAFTLQNTGAVATANLVATLLATNGVAAPSGPQNYGVLAAGGGTALQSFTFTATGACVTTVSPRLQLQDGALNLGTVSVVWQLGQLGPVFAQNFDTVTRPALPAGWTTSASGVQSPWITTNSLSDTASNSVYSTDAGNIGVNELNSPPIVLPLGQSTLSFRHRYSFESDTALATNAYDGGVLDIKIGTNAFNDIITNGGSWIANGYNRKIDSRYGNPLTNRWAWSGTNGGFVTTTVTLPPAAAGQTIQLRWRAGTDTSNAGGGWWVDTLSITGYVCCANTGPVLPVQTNRTINELTLLTVTNTATDAESPPEILSYALQVGPTNASISTNGIITWTPTEAQGPGAYTFTTVVSDGASPPLSATNAFSVTVNDVNSAPMLTVPSDQTISELIPWSANATASDADLPTNALAFELVSGPGNLMVSPGGLISWTPGEDQGPSTNTITLRVFDNGTPSLGATNSFSLVVSEVNSAPMLTMPTNQTISELGPWSANATASDADMPTNALTFELVSGPANLTVSPGGLIGWAPGEDQGPSTNTITLRVFDNGTPSLGATNSFTLAVNEVNSAPMLAVPTNQTISELGPWSANATASDADLPTNTLTFELVSGPANLTVSPGGLIGWTPGEDQGPSTNTITLRVFDNGTPSLGATNSFSLVVSEVNSAPMLTMPTNQTISELGLWSASATATDADLPTNTLAFELVSGPSNLTVSSSGLISWTPSEAHGPGTYPVTVRVYDNGVPSLSSTNTFDLTVNEVNSPPVLPLQTNQTVFGLTALVVTNTATDSDLPVNSLVYTLLTGPTNAAIDTNGVISWTPEPGQMPGTNLFTTVVTDSNSWALTAQSLSATNTFTVVVEEPIHHGPVLPTQPDRTMDELTTLVVTNMAMTLDMPPPILTYQLMQRPDGMVIDSSGIITWSPSEYDGPGAYIVETVVTDNGVPPLSATNTFNLTVNEVNSPPQLGILSDAVLSAGQTFSSLNAGSDLDRPYNTMSYQLIEAPSGATINSSGMITWTPASWQAPSTNVFTTVASDDNPWAVTKQHLSATNSFTLRVFEPGIPPLIVNLNVAGDAAMITWSTITGKTYRLQYKDSPGDTTWNDLLPDIAASNSLTTATNPLGSSSARLYRVFQLP
jgi:hypothetical protein